ncbi:hypothetical protein CAL14_08530 [Bordetella genomosp. 9]|uniref:phage baseplate protein n=1 Tax=Bordetella genomosp. 9 TaxID=1416803 RepID=UPI000A295998|nr:hypothetical protein [Bordetella genomosp. 9]ARP90327.1 hypothetical protein CAL14_08530 [Bordetella genomosp. 9]
MIGDLLSDIFLRTPRALGEIIPQVAIEEVHRDEVAITDHPVEQGAAISDHAFKMPAELIIRYGWSESRDIFDIIQDGGLVSVDDVYRRLLEMQEMRQPFDVITKRRAYKNMLIRSLQVTTDQRTNNILMVQAALRQVIIVQVTTVKTPPKTAQAYPVDTAPPINAGVKQAKPVNESILYKVGSISGALGL